jgi:hypothetical protein
MRAMGKRDRWPFFSRKSFASPSAILAKASDVTAEVTSDTTKIEYHGSLGAGL